MNELGLQKLVIDAVRRDQGFGFKLSNKFLIGIPDLFLHLPVFGTGLWEVKLNDKPKVAESVKLNVTPLQEKVLTDYEKAGGCAGVISFIRTPANYYINAYLMEILAYSDANLAKNRVSILHHEVLPRGKREDTIISVLKRVYSYHASRDNQRHIQGISGAEGGEPWSVRSECGSGTEDQGPPARRKEWVD